MKKNQATLKRKIPPPPGPGASINEIVAYHTKYTLDELDQAGYTEDPSPEHIAETEAAGERAMARDKVKGLAKAYPRTHRNRACCIEEIIHSLAPLPPKRRKALAARLDLLADQAHDLDEIMHRILEEDRPPQERAELFMTFQTVLDHVRSYAESLGNDIYAVFDHVKGLEQINNYRNGDTAAKRHNGKPRGKR